MPRIEGDLARALQLLHDYFGERQIPFALIGALVPALLLSPATGGRQMGVRETRDADHVIKLASWAEWETVLADLEHLGFRPGRGEQEHRLYYGEAEIDLIPYGVAEGPDDVLIWPKSGNRMNLTGFADVFRHAVPTEIVPGLTLPVVPLWLFAVLKIVAYLDRRLPRDVVDLAFVLEHYEEDDPEARRFDVLGEDDGITYETAGAFLLGCDIRSRASDQSRTLVADFLGQIADEHHAVINTALREKKQLYFEERRKALFNLLMAFRQGLTHRAVI